MTPLALFLAAVTVSALVGTVITWERIRRVNEALSAFDTVQPSKEVGPLEADESSTSSPTTEEHRGSFQVGSPVHGRKAPSHAQTPQYAQSWLARLMKRRPVPIPSQEAISLKERDQLALAVERRLVERAVFLELRLESMTPLQQEMLRLRIEQLVGRMGSESEIGTTVEAAEEDEGG